MNGASTLLAPTVIYPAQGICTLVSRSWYLFRANFKTSMLLMLVPTILLTLVSVLMSLPAAVPSLTSNSATGLLITLVSVISGFILMLVSFFAWGYGCCALARVFYSAIVMERPISLNESLGFLKKIWLPLLGLIFVMTLVTLGFGLLNLAIYIFGILGSFGLFSSLGFFPNLTHAPNALVMVMAVLIFLVWGFVILAMIISLITLQTFACLFPFIAVATSDGTRMLDSIFYAFKLLFSNLPKTLVFGIVLLLFSFILSLVFHFPVILWTMLEMMRLGLNQRMVMPFHINVVFQIWSSLINIFLVPYLIGAVTLFWYDCRVRKEGLDLKLWFTQIAKRKGKDPNQFINGLAPFEQGGTV